MDNERTIQAQQQFMEIFGSADWDVYRKEERKLLYDKVGLAIFGLPDEGYGKEQKHHIKKVTDTIIREDVHDDGESGNTWMSIIVLLVQPPESNYYRHHVFRVPKYTGRAYNRHTFIDCIGRVYKNWNDFLENNKLPRSEVCYPVNGVYRRDILGRVFIDFTHLQSSDLLGCLDLVGGVIALGSSAVAVVDWVQPLPAALAAAAVLGSYVTQLYGATRAAQDQLDRNKHGQSVGLADKISFSNWASIIITLCIYDLAHLNAPKENIKKSLWMSIYEYIWGAEEVAAVSSLSLSSRLVIACRAASSCLRSMTPQQMFSNFSAEQLLLRDISSYALLFGHTVMDSEYAVDSQQILDLKSTGCETIGDDKVRYLEYVGLQNQIPTQISDLGTHDDNCEIQLSFTCDRQTFGKIVDYIQECINSTLNGKWIKHVLLDIKDPIEFFCKYGLLWAIKVTKQIVSVINCPKVEEAFCGILAGFHSFIQNLRKVALRNGNTSLYPNMLTTRDIIEVVKICINKQYDFYTKFGKLFLYHILPRIGSFAISRSRHYMRRLTDDEMVINPALRDSEIFYAASEAVGSPLNDSNAKIARANDHCFVVITDSNIDASVVQIVWEMENGKVNATVVRKNCENGGQE